MNNLFNDFVEETTKRLSKDMNCEVTTRYVTQNNGTGYLGVCAFDGSNVSPSINLTRFFQSYEQQQAKKSIQNNESIIDYENAGLDEEIFGEVYKNILYTFQANKPCRGEGIDVSAITDFEKAKKHLAFRIVKSDLNQDVEGPTIDILDLKVIFYLFFELGEEGATIQVTDSLADKWGVSAEEIFKEAKENMEVMLPASVMSINDMLSEAIECMESPVEPTAEIQDAVPMIVATNNRRSLGAAVMLYKEVLEDIRECLDTNEFYILPSSIHEVIGTTAGSAEDLNAMVCEVNDTQVANSEVLSDHAYKYADGCLSYTDENGDEVSYKVA